MGHEPTPVGQTAPRFFRSRVRPPTPGAVADQETAAAHGYVPPQPPPGTDPRLWCSIHHRLLVITKPPERRLFCAQCLPAYQLAGADGKGRVSLRTGLRCARIKCFAIARFDLWGVPVCSPRCVALIGNGAGVRLLGCVLRVIAFPAFTKGRWVVVAFYPSGIQAGAFERRTIRIHWWVPGRPRPGSTLLRMPPCGPSVDDDRVCGYFLGRLARSLTIKGRTNSFSILRGTLYDWRRGVGPRPWIETTLEPAIRHAVRP